ncbi:hypothetical protein [Curtobacterium sp. MCBA15_012]|uniref:hypothetical protein n=1 Tax=Curtobacterium sp. MCBA15_012 TaxID=1898738 RepID=UPI0008DCCBB8|nr:hypothetical protein [Curtobacterium sp. MCBA15_012]WIA99459.1 hypothetical protein QOL15_13170 [Curtobacterium sp. MCBA15_012]
MSIDDQGPQPAWNQTDDGAEPGAGVVGRTNAVVVAVVLPILLLVSWWIQLAVLLQSSFAPEDERPGPGGVLTGFLFGALLAVGVPVAVVVTYAVKRRRQPRTSLAAVISAIVVLVIAVPFNVIGITAQAGSVAEDARLRAQPATAAERHFSDGEDDPEAALNRIGDRTVELLGSRRSDAFRSDGSPKGGAYSEPCLLDNRHEGLQWEYWFTAAELVDASGADLLPEGAETVPGGTTDMSEVVAAWKAEGIRAERSDVGPEEQYEPRADWLSPSSYARPGPTVTLRTICLER